MDTGHPVTRMTPLLAFTLVVASLSAGFVSATEVYKAVDAEGHVVYTDHADPNAPKTAVQIDTPSAKHAAKAAKIRAAQQAADQQRQKQQALEAAKIAKLDHDANVQCDEAQKTFYAMKAEGATDGPAILKREQARQSMVLACTD